ncbi:large ribosomal subunit protein uL18m [Bacillus rossius redtenbacheri]|uniref:large ribosomal subunit protein uL18m n=1 Tax=Bacillus rossius redtenbacheri TaxID=93214 RepID=UPI002FDEB361
MFGTKVLQSLIAPRSIHASVLARSTSGDSTVRDDFCNRNPRNLERLRIAYKCGGYHLEKPGRDFWHKLLLSQTKRCVKAEIVHQSGSTVVSASTAEWAIKQFLYSTVDSAAYQNLGRVLAERCLETGLTEVRCDLHPEPGSKVAAFLANVEEGGVTLSEPARFLPHRPWDDGRPDKPWAVVEEG